jgi:hypothetical protein
VRSTPLELVGAGAGFGGSAARRVHPFTDKVTARKTKRRAHSLPEMHWLAAVPGICGSFRSAVCKSRLARILAQVTTQQPATRPPRVVQELSKTPTDLRRWKLP